MFNRSTLLVARNALVCLSLIVLLAACGDSEPEQRKAFIDIIQKNVLDQRGGRLVFMNEAEKKAVGPYGAHFDFLIEAVQADEKFDLDGKTNTINKLTDALLRTEDAEKRRDILIEVDNLKNGVRKDLEGLIVELTAKKAALKQPDDLKVVFDKAYDKFVTAPADVALKIFNASDVFMKAVRDINDYVIANPKKVKYQGADILILDDSAEGAVNKLLEAQTAAYNEMQKVIQEAMNLQRNM